METDSQFKPLKVKGGWKQEAQDFMVSDREALSIRVFECLFTLAFLCCLGHSFFYWREWLTNEGIHLNAEEMKALRYPPPWPVLNGWQVALFAGLILIGSGLVLWPRSRGGKIADFMLRPGVQKTGFGILFVCALYAQRADYVAATMVNRLFVAVCAVLALSPPMRRCATTGRLIQSVAPVRLLQASLILQYFASGLAKLDADWLRSADVLWSHVQGLHRTDLAAYALRVMPRWTWTAQQYATLFFEVGAPLLFTLRFLRPVAIVMGVTFHLLIALMMQDLILYGLVMWSFYALFLPASFWSRISRFLNQGRATCPGDVMRDAALTADQEKLENKIWSAKLGGWQSDLLTRSLGLLFYLNLLCHLLKRSVGDFLTRYPVATLYLGLCGLALMLAGPRLFLFILAFLAGTDFFLKVLYGEGGPGLHQQAAEYPFFVLMPFSLTLLVLAMWRRTSTASSSSPEERWAAFQEGFERQCVMFFRWAALTTLFFVSFHKMNEDFFNAATSCEGAVKQFYSKNWSFEWLPALASISAPWMVVLLEGPVPIALLLTFRKLGVIVVALVYGTIAFCDALTITLCLILPSLAFLTSEDRHFIKSHSKILVLIWAGILAVWLPFSCSNYLGIRPWFQPALYQSIVIAVLVTVGGAQIISLVTTRADGLRRSPLRRLGFKVATLVPTGKTGRWVVGCAMVVWLLNGFSPYLGFKFNYSFAMLSNLRVDDARWNHLFMPKWIRLTKHDGFFHVHKATVQYGSKENAKLKGAVTLRSGLFSPEAFHDEMKRLRSLRGAVELTVLFEHQGSTYDFQGQVSDLSFLTFLDKLPQPHGHWLHDYLPAQGPMGCKH